jgi:hypothetical protein
LGLECPFLFFTFHQAENFALSSPWSDIDLAVWGIAPSQFYREIGVLNEISPEFKVDLVDPTDRTCRPSVKQAIERTGLIV